VNLARLSQSALGRNAKIHFWPTAFNNTLPFLAEACIEWGLETEWSAFEIAERIPLSAIARTRELVEHPVRRRHVVVTLRASE
jgi:hypothetical protein